MVVSKHLTYFCYPIRLMLHQHLNSHVTYPGIPHENSNHTQAQYQHLPCTLYSDYSDQALSKLVDQKEDFRSVSVSFTQELHLAQSMDTISDIIREI